jgi:hypothetical protein
MKIVFAIVLLSFIDKAKVGHNRARRLIQKAAVMTRFYEGKRQIDKVSEIA